MRIKIYYFLSFFILLIAVPIVFLYQGTNNVVNAACVNNCARWVVEPCKDQRGNSCSGGHANCDGNSIGVRYCRICKEPCDSNPPRCEPRTLDCSNTCGQPNRCASNGCGGQSCCAATAPCPPTVPPACVDSDGGSAPNVAGKVTISAPALPQVLNDSCMVLKTTQNGGTTTTQWIIQATGTHVGEKTCTNTVTGAYADSVIACANGCIDGACSTVVNPCPKRPQGDANCDQSINDADFEVIKSAMRGLRYAALNHSADFNNNGRVDLVDYEIWRNTAKQ